MPVRKAKKRPVKGKTKATRKKVVKKKVAKKKVVKKKSKAKVAKKKPVAKKKVVKKKVVKKKLVKTKVVKKKLAAKPKAVKPAVSPKPKVKAPSKAEAQATAKAARAARAEKRKMRTRFRKLLLAKQKSLVAAYHHTKDDTRTDSSDGTEDYIDYAVSSYHRDFTLSLTEMERKQLLLVEESLKRLAGGEYGNCLNCATTIPEKRLEVEPWARYCIPCQELDELGRLDERYVDDDEDDDEDDAAGTRGDEDGSDDE